MTTRQGRRTTRGSPTGRPAVEMPRFDAFVSGVGTMALPGTGQSFSAGAGGGQNARSPYAFNLPTAAIEPRPTAAEWLSGMRNGPSYGPPRTPQDRWGHPDYLFTDMEVTITDTLMYYDGPILVLAMLGEYFGLHLGVRSVDVVPDHERWIFVHVPDDGYMLSAIRTGEMPFYDLFKAGNCVVVDVKGPHDTGWCRTFETLGADIPDDCLPERGFAAAC
jgi:hypothetical protein